MEEEAIDHLHQQIQVIKDYSHRIDESQGLVANAMNMLVSSQYNQAMANCLEIIKGMLDQIMERLPEKS